MVVLVVLEVMLELTQFKTVLQHGTKVAAAVAAGVLKAVTVQTDTQVKRILVQLQVKRLMIVVSVIPYLIVALFMGVHNAYKI
jgi:hypothetical protein